MTTTAVVALVILGPSLLLLAVLGVAQLRARGWHPFPPAVVVPRWLAPDDALDVEVRQVGRARWRWEVTPAGDPTTLAEGHERTEERAARRAELAGERVLERAAWHREAVRYRLTPAAGPSGEAQASTAPAQRGSS